MLILAASVLLAADLSRPPAAQWTTRAALAGIHLYQATLSPLYARVGAQCRFKPSCSHYGEAVVREYGAMRGGWMAFKRILRCGPWTPMGTVDVPKGSDGRALGFGLYSALRASIGSTASARRPGR